MYIDGHERDNIVQYCKEFLVRWSEYEKQMVTYDSETGEPNNTLQGFPMGDGRPFRLILVTHNESTFYANDPRKIKWSHLFEDPKAQPKGDGQSIMVSDFLTLEWGQLKDNEQEAHILFKAGAQRDGYFKAEDLIAQVDRAIDIFEGKTNGFAVGLFMFDNTPSHQKRAADALSAHKMPKNPNEGWTHHPSGPKMRNGVLANGESQLLCYPDDHPTMPGWFKGMETIIREHGLWP